MELKVIGVRRSFLGISDNRIHLRAVHLELYKIRAVNANSLEYEDHVRRNIISVDWMLTRVLQTTDFFSS